MRLRTAVQQTLRIARLGGNVLRWTLEGMTGRHAPLPPGSLGPAGVSKLGDESFHVRRMAAYGPVFKMLWSRRLGIGIAGFDRAKRLFEAHDDRLALMTIEIEHLVPKGAIRAMRGADHAHYRLLFAKAMRPELVDAFSTRLRAIVDDALLALADHPPGSADAEALTTTLDRITLRSLVLLFHGLDPASRAGAAFAEAYLRLGPTGFVYPLGPAQHAAFAELRALTEANVAGLRDDILGRRQHHAESADPQCVLGRLIAESGPDAVDATVIGNVIYMVEIGRYDMRGLLRWIAKHLSDHPAEVQALRATPPESLGDRASACVMETLRLAQAEALNRVVLEEFEFEGHRYPVGASVRVLLRETHRDPAAFEDPSAYRPCRFAGRMPPASVYSPFGLGDRRCTAARIVGALGTIFVESLVSGFDWQTRGGRAIHWGGHHWEPAHDFALAMTRRPASHAVEAAR